MSSPSRSLGPNEQLFWLSDQVGTFNFVVAAEVTGGLEPDLLRRGLAALQRRHALLSVGIDGWRFNAGRAQAILEAGIAATPAAAPSDVGA